jgi:hypothetical protein
MSAPARSSATSPHSRAARDVGLYFRIVRSHGHEYTDPPHSLRLLRAGRKRPRHRRTTEKRDELAPSHCIPRGSGQSILTAQTTTLIGAKTGIKTIAAVHSKCRSWVISDRAIQAPDDRLSAMPPIATAVAAMQRMTQSATSEQILGHNELTLSTRNSRSVR